MNTLWLGLLTRTRNTLVYKDFIMQLTWYRSTTNLTFLLRNTLSPPLPHGSHHGWGDRDQPMVSVWLHYTVDIEWGQSTANWPRLLDPVDTFLRKIRVIVRWFSTEDFRFCSFSCQEVDQGDTQDELLIISVLCIFYSVSMKNKLW